MLQDLEIKRGKIPVPTFCKMMQKPFGDSEEYMKMLFDTGYIKKENIFSLTSGSDILSVMCLFEAETFSVGKTYVISYVYTPEEYRGRGYSSLLISSFLKTEKNTVVVFPATKSLFSYYSRFGFTPCAFSERFLFENGEKRELTKVGFSEEIYSLYLSSRKKNEVYKPKELFAAAIKEAEISDGGLFMSDGSFAFSYVENGVRIVTEPFGKDEKAVAKAFSANEKTWLILPSEKKDEPLAMTTGGENLYADNFLNFNQYI